MIDVDHFKQVNDRLGHRTGDAVLRAVAGRLVAAVRGGDVVGRYGGEEFAVVLGAERRVAAAAAERVRRAVADEPVATAEGSVPVMVSIGLACAGARADLDELLDRADACLYRAKGAGRDRVVADGPAPPGRRP